MKKTNSFLNAILPAILMQLATGSVYCFSVYQTELSKIFDFITDEMVQLIKKCRCGRYLFLCNNMEICLVCNIIKKW